MLTKRDFLLAGAGLSMCDLGLPAAAELAPPHSFPSRPVRWVVPYTSGGATDVISRLICQRLSQRLGQPFVVENKPGAGAAIGTEAVINSPADGYTLLLISTANAINASFDKTLRHDFSNAIAPVCGLARIPLVMVVGNQIPAKTVPEFIAYAKAHPQTLAFGSSGPGTSLHLSGELFKAMTGIDFVHVPYKGSAPALTDLMSGQIQVLFDNVTSSVELIRAGKVRALGVTTREHSEALPDVPSISESLPAFETSSFYGVGAPRGTPAHVVELLNREINAALENAEIKQSLGALGAMPLPGTAEQFGAMLAAETARWRKIVEVSGPQTN
jgi:tripartite-type tricarboxylate transporter receptor subunit TctC